MEKKKKKKTKAKVHYIRDRVVSGKGPHKLYKMEIKNYLDKKKAEKSVCKVCTEKVVCDTCKELAPNVFDIDTVEWKELG